MTKDQRNFYISCILLAAIAVGGSVLSRNSAAEEKTSRVSVIVPDSSSDEWTSFFAGVRDAANENQITLNILTTSNALTAEEEYILASKEISDGSSGILLAPLPDDNQNLSEEIRTLSQQVPVMMVDNTAEDLTDTGNYALTAADDAQIAYALSSEILIGAKESSCHSVGIICQNTESSSMSTRIQTLTEILNANDISIAWTLSGDSRDDAGLASVEHIHPCDAIVALDCSSLEFITDQITAKNIRSMPVYGTGTSMKCVSALDNGTIRTIITSNEYQKGYLALQELSSAVNHSYVMKNQYISWHLINQENLFSEQNQQLLFAAYK